MRDILIEALKSRFASYQDIIENVAESDLGHKLDVPKHKSLGEQFWCVVGARESYAKAIAAGSWAGFGCSLTDFSHKEYIEKLSSSAEEVAAAIDGVDEWNAERDALLLSLFEHEVMHEGQIIRHMYGTESDIPATVRWA